MFVNDRIRFASLMINSNVLKNVRPFPNDIMRWTELVYRRAFNQLGAPRELAGLASGAADTATSEEDLSFQLQENDYCFGTKKFGGNAQRVSRNIWVHVRCHCHPTETWLCCPIAPFGFASPTPCIMSLSQHTSFLWELDSEAITRYLTLPPKRPEYRRSRPHSDFLCALGPHVARPRPAEGGGSPRPQFSCTAEELSALTRTQTREAVAGLAGRAPAADGVNAEGADAAFFDALVDSLSGWFVPIETSFSDEAVARAISKQNVNFVSNEVAL